MITIRVPGTTANLGPGFDCLGLALGVYGYFTFEERESGLEFENVAPEFQNEDNLAIRGYRRAIQELGLAQPGIYLHIESDIPVSSGLGSSASLIVAGVVAANELHGRLLNSQTLLNLVTELEGHPDNVAPALLGGVTASLLYGGNVITMQCPISDQLRFAVLIPDFSLSTAEMRAALPKQIPFADAAYNIAHAAVLLKALEAGDFDAIAAAMDDKLHQPYRSPLIHEYDEIRSRALEAGALGFAISGAGPTLFCVYRDEGFYWRMKQAVRSLKHAWRVMPLPVDRVGAVVVGGGQE